MVHDNVALRVSQDEAAAAEDEAKRRLLSAKKLSLVVDLDQTVIQATVDPTVAEWQKDPINPNYEAVKDVRSFQLKDDGPGGNGMWYYIKLRPGLESFLENMSTLYELHIYTMGTRAYARQITDIIDPKRKIFGNRVLSRSENGSMSAKNLQRLFPVDTKMVVIIDDRGDVWNWIENLIKVTPFDFFIGIGDINASFLPKRPEVLQAAPDSTSKPAGTAVGGEDPDNRSEPHNSEVESEKTEDSGQTTESLSQPSVRSTASNASTLDQLVSMSGGDDPSLLQELTHRQDEAIAAQLTDRPLLQKQKELEAEDPISDAAAIAEDTEGEIPTIPNTSTATERTRHHLLRDDDRELHYLEKALRKVHAEFFETHARQVASIQGGRLGQLRPGEKRKQPLHANSDLAVVPDMKVLLPQVKRTVLNGVVIVFSGVKPLHIDLNQFDQAILARNFGAGVEQRINKRTTHVVAGNARTNKAKTAFKRNIKVVGSQWVTDSITQWEKLDEEPYLLKYDGADPLFRNGEDGDDILSDSEDPPSPESEEDDPSANSRRKRPALSLDINDDEESDIEGVLPSDAMDDKSPIGGGKEDWQVMNDDLADFLAEGDSNDENSDKEGLASGTASVDSNQSAKSTKSNISIRGKKRSRPGPEEIDSDESESPGKKQKKRGTTLSQTVVTGDKDNGLPTPDITGGEEAKGLLEKSNAADEDAADEGGGWSDFDDDLEAEMEKAAKEEQGKG